MLCNVVRADLTLAWRPEERWNLECTLRHEPQRAASVQLLQWAVLRHAEHERASLQPAHAPVYRLSKS